MKIRIEIGEALAGLSAYGSDACSRLNEIGSAAALEMENFAKQNRPWTDRTGNARRTLQGVCDGSGGNCTVGVEGNMPYSVFLELDYGGRYAILAPTVRHFAPEILLAFAHGLSSMK